MEEIAAEELEKRIREILKFGSVIYSQHVKQRMGERSYNISDVQHILKNGKVSDIVNKGNEQYGCKVTGEDIEGYQGAVITIVIKNIELIIVTVLGGV